MKDVTITDLTPVQKAKLFKELQADRKTSVAEMRTSYEALRKDVVVNVMGKVETMADDVKSLFDFVSNEMTAFYEIMSDYGQLSTSGQMSYKIEHGDFKIEVKTNKIKKFDERANLAAKRLVEFLNGWMEDSAKGTDDPMYQLAMSMVSRNHKGDLDYKSISKLYELESKFGSPEYSEIMQLFKESNKVDSTATNFYFYRKDERNVWQKIEISFNRL